MIRATTTLVDGAPVDPVVEEEEPAKSEEQLLAERLAGGTSSPTMPWGAGPRPDDWVDPSVAPVTEPDAPAPAAEPVTEPAPAAPEAPPQE